MLLPDDRGHRGADQPAICPDLSLGQSFLLTSTCRHADRTVSSLRLAAQAWRTVSEDSGELHKQHLQSFLLIVCTRRIVTAVSGE
jgi:hypothetical protein